MGEGEGLWKRLQDAGKVGAIVGAVAGMLPAVEAQGQSARIEFHDKNLYLNVTPRARQIMQGFGYSFAISDERVQICAPEQQCIDLRAELRGTRNVLGLDIRSVDTAAGARVLMCRINQMEEREVSAKIFLFEPRLPESRPSGFIPIDESQPDFKKLADQCFEDLLRR